MANFKIKDDGSVAVTESCGCIFCDLGDTPKDFEGKPTHYQRDFSIVLCTKDTALTPKRVQ